MKKLIPFIILLGIICFPGFAQKKKNTSIESRLKGVEAELNQVLETWKAAGFAVAVVEKNRVVYAKGFGYRDYEKKIPATENTLFAIGSCSKSFTTSLLGILENEDKLSLDDSPRKHIPYMKFFNSNLDDEVTIKDMMSHRTGLPRHDFAWYFFPSTSKDSLLMRVEYQEPFTGIREQWYYNNFMFLAQGVIAEKITGKSWEENVKERIFTPLSMKESNLDIVSMKSHPQASFGYELNTDDEIKKMDYYDISGMSPAGSINSSVSEMANWVITWINGGKFKGKEVVPASFVTSAMSSQMVVAGGIPGEDNPDLHMANYGYGWFTSSYKGHYRVEHGGNIDGFSASTSFYPSDSLGIVVLVNQNGSAVPAVVRNIISDRILGVEKTDWNKQIKESRDKALKAQKEAASSVESSRVTGTKPSHSMLQYTGEYSHPGYGKFEIVAEDDSLFADFPLMQMWLNHYHYDVFEPIEVEDNEIDTAARSPLRFNFSTNDSGDISGVKIKIEPALDGIEFKRTPSTIEVDEATLEYYVGEYSLMGIIAKVYIKEGALYFFVPGQPEYELLPTDTHKFSFKIVDGFKLEFSENEDGEIIDVLVIQPQGNFKATKN